MVGQRKRLQLVLFNAALLGLFLVLQRPCHAQPAGLVNQNSPVKLSARFHIEKAKRTGFLIVKAVIPKGSHIYSLNQKPPLTPTRLIVSEMNELRATGNFSADKKSHVVENDPIFEARVEKHSGTIQFYAPIEIATGVDPARLKPMALFSGQVCSDEGYCIPVSNQKVPAEFAGYFERQAKQQVPSKADRR